jgi:hypothetical protein
MNTCIFGDARGLLIYDKSHHGSCTFTMPLTAFLILTIRVGRRGLAMRGKMDARTSSPKTEEHPRCEFGDRARLILRPNLATRARFVSVALIAFLDADCGPGLNGTLCACQECPDLPIQEATAVLVDVQIHWTTGSTPRVPDIHTQGSPPIDQAPSIVSST